MTKYLCENPSSSGFETVKFFFGKDYIYRRTKLGVKSFRIADKTTNEWGSEVYTTRTETSELAQIKVMKSNYGTIAVETRINGIVMLYHNDD